MLINKIFDLSYLNITAWTKQVYLYQDVYNPKSFPLFLPRHSERNCKTRWTLIESALDKHHIKPGSFLDIGSQVGYYVFQFAQKGFVSQGLEMNQRTVAYARVLANLNQTEHVSFNCGTITPEFAKKLPNYTVISMLSVFHHLLHFQGEKAALDILRQLAQKSSSAFFFESGEPTEEGYYWSKAIQKLTKEKYDHWVRSFFAKLGFKTIIALGTSPNHLNDTHRTLYLMLR